MSADVPTAPSPSAEPPGQAQARPALGLHPRARKPQDAQPRAPLRAADPHYLPTLFDRLCDDAPSQRSEAPGAYAPDRKRMRAILQRDLSLLLNTINHHHHLEPERYPEVARSCVNFGVPPLAGRTLSERRWAAVETAVRQAILNYEPRILPETLIVKPLRARAGSAAAANPCLLDFEISGQVHMLPYPMEFVVQTSADLEAQRIELRLPPEADVEPAAPWTDPGQEEGGGEG
ncbi:type VI secretion system baseplate subunit TssE [Roseateles sp. BYS180W]|uniref:Type VI secretion system baseplate subunit TssE n=1 Tax=Roseateles rivi TaxID=3299028 RepID=A0ABW7FSZ4_9BURK